MRARDVIVIGAGFGGLAAALRSAERGRDVLLCEALSYPGGCACTFERDGHRFEGGATLFSGLGEGQLFRRWIDRYELDVNVAWLDPVVRFRTPDFELAVPRDRAAFVERVASLPGAPRAAVYAFFAEQARVADLLWGLLDDPKLLPPLDLGGLLRHLPRLPRYLPLLRFVNRPLLAVLERHGLADFRPLRLYLDALCQITVQCGVAEAEAAFALGTMDYYFRGTGHIEGGIGTLAHGLVDAIREAGGEVAFRTEVRGVRREGDAWIVQTNRGTHRARRVVANVLPQGLPGLGVPARPGAEEVERGWGACMLYLVPKEKRDPGHLQIVQDPSAPLLEGNHLFASRGETITVSTHVRPGGDVPAVHARMREGLARLAPEWEIASHFTASPRTFERWTRRPRGLVGGVPRRAGWRHYTRFSAPQPAPGLHLVGDSFFPGQSTLATALGGYKLAEQLAR